MLRVYKRDKTASDDIFVELTPGDDGLLLQFVDADGDVADCGQIAFLKQDEDGGVYLELCGAVNDELASTVKGYVKVTRD